MSTKTRFEKEAKGNSEMVYCATGGCLFLYWTFDKRFFVKQLSNV